MLQTSHFHQVPLTVAICTYARGEILLRTLDSVLPQAAALPAEVLIIDQQFDHPPAILDRLAALDREGVIRWLRVDTDSLTGKRNIALREASADIVLYIDDDVILPPGFLLRHLQHYQQSPTLAGLTGQVYHAQDPDSPPGLDDPTRNATAHFEARKAVEGSRLKVKGRQGVRKDNHQNQNLSDGSPDIHAQPFNPSTFNLQPSTDAQSKIQNQKSKILPSRHFIGCNHSVKKKAAESIGGYDEQFIASSQCEDFDVADRLADAGYFLGYDPDLWLIHLRARSGGTRGGTVWPEWTRTANIFLYMFRHAHTHKNHASLVWRALRTGPLRKDIVRHPSQWLGAWSSLIKGVVYGWRHRRFQLSI